VEEFVVSNKLKYFFTM